jgi:malonyl-CoA O-methyltransferase
VLWQKGQYFGKRKSNKRENNLMERLQRMKIYQELKARRERLSVSQNSSNKNMIAENLCEGMLDRLSWMTISPEVVLDFSVDQAHVKTHLLQRFPEAKHFLGYEYKPFDNTSSCLPFHENVFSLETNSVDCVFLNLRLALTDNFQVLLSEIARLLKPNGLFIFSSLGPDTFREFREAWCSVDEGHHVYPFPDMHDVGDALLAAGMQDPVMDTEGLQLHYSSFDRLYKDMTDWGFRNTIAQRKVGLTTPRQLSKMQAFYQARSEDGPLVVTYECVYGHAWGKGIQEKKRDEISIPVSEIKRRL